MLRREHLVVESRLEVLMRIQLWFKEICQSLDPDLGWIQNHFDYLNLALAEGFTNAVRHAHAMLPPETPVEIRACFSRDRIEIHIWDQGDPFDPSKLMEPEPGSLLPEGGYGWFLLRRAADEVNYQRVDGRNRLMIVQYR